MRQGTIFGLLCLGVVSLTGVTRAETTAGETIRQAACRLVESAAHDTGLPVALLTRLIWAESRFQARVVSPAGAMGIVQFMPDTAAQRGLLDPYDPEQAIPKAAALLVDLQQQFGNIGLAVAAYNAGSSRVASWLARAGSLPAQTQSYVLILTGRSADDWAARGSAPLDGGANGPLQSCIDISTTLQVEDRADQLPVTPWGVQLAGNFSKAVALASFERMRQRYLAPLSVLQPMVIGTALRSRGTRRFYRIFVPASSRADADQLCHAILASGGPCDAVRTQ